ncbi:MAG: hypothetical protein J7J61_06625 [Candidatus Hydrothermae bacterium]|nr:hypothetical protein [Candidatus Hydrothermae bacterium]
MWFVIYEENGEICWKEVESLKEIDEEKAKAIYKEEEFGETFINLLKAAIDIVRAHVPLERIEIVLVPAKEIH